MSVATAVTDERPTVAVEQAPPEGARRYAGLATRLVAFVIDAALIDLVAVIVGLAAALVGGLFHFPKDLHTLWIVLGATAYVLWSVGYFVVFWSTTGQTPGARVMQIRVVTFGGDTPNPLRALVRAIGVILATLPLCLGFVPTLFDRQRRALQDYLARTLVVSSPQRSIAQGQRERMRARKLESSGG